MSNSDRPIQPNASPAPPADVPGRKWFGAYSIDSGEVAATELLRERRDRLVRCIELVRTEPTGKRIRKLRVATRRADTAARFVLPLSNPKSVKKARRTLRTLRRAGGAVRRCDVFIERLQGTAAAAKGDDVGMAAVALIGRLGAERARAFRAFLELLPNEDATRALDAIAISPGKEVGADALAKALITDARTAFAETASIPTLDTEALHTLRLRGKRMRYTAEAVAPLVGDSSAAALIHAVTSLQDDLGSINDLAELAEELAVFHAEVADLPGASRVRAGTDRMLLAAASERDRRSVAFAANRRARINEILTAASRLEPRVSLRLTDDVHRSETA